jgi:hypothetical protein
VTNFAADPWLHRCFLVGAGPRERPERVERLISLAPDLVLVANWSDAAVSQPAMRGARLPHGAPARSPRSERSGRLARTLVTRPRTHSEMQE